MEGHIQFRKYNYKRLYRRLYSPWYYLPIVGLVVFQGHNWLLAFICDVALFFILMSMIDLFVVLFFKTRKLTRYSWVHLLYCFMLIFTLAAMQVMYYFTVVDNLPDSMGFIMNS